MKAVLVFCEGRHDVVFAQRSLGAHGACDWVDRPVRELPSPFGRSGIASKGIIATRLEQHAIEDHTLQAAAHPSLPCFESVVENTVTDTIFFMIRAHGEGQIDPILELLQSLHVTVADEPAGTFDVSEYSAAFLYDANGKGVTSTLEDFRDRYASHFGNLSNLEHGKWLAGTLVPVGCFVFHKSAQDQTGTLENHLDPMAAAAWPNQHAAAKCFVENTRAGDDKVSSKEAERLKAIITVTGQFNHPGDPMSIIIGRNGIPHAQFLQSTTSAEVAQFLTHTPWRGR